MERSMKKILVLLAALVLVLAMAGCSKSVDSVPSLNEALAAEGTQTLKLTEDLVLTEPLVVNGNKTISGSGTITLNITDAVAGEEGPGFSLLGCPKLTAEDWSADAAVLQVAEGASLTLEGDIIIDGAGVSNGVVALKGAAVTLTGNAIVQNGLNCGIYVCEGATLNVSGGSVLTSLNHGIVNLGTMNVTGGTLSGTEAGAVIYNAGALDISEGVITGGGVHNIYAAAGTVNVTGGKIDWAAKDGIVVASGASATVTGGAIENCGTHGLCNGGTMETGAINLYECGIANQAGGTLNMTDTTVEISPVYCLANMGGTVTATNFSALSCDVTSVCNFAGDMTLENLTVKGSRAGDISNESGNLTVNGATLGLCREKPINVGSGVARLDNVTVEGTTGEYFGAYIYGGELYLSNSSINFINYSALRADGQCYVELNNVTVDDTMASGIWARGATIVANKLSLNNIRGHAINNSGGNITITDLKATNIGKNAIIQDNGVTTLNSVSFQNVGDQGAYVKNGTLNINDAWFDNIAQNGVYSLPDSTAQVHLKDVTYSRVAKYGLNNGYAMSARNVTILCNSGTGILNKKEMYLENVLVTAPAKDCIYNDAGATLTAYYVTCEKAGEGSTALFNRGSVLMYGMTIKDSENGLTNKETGIVSGDGLTVTGIKNYGIRNQGKVENLANITISDTGNHGINNEKGSAFVGSNILISGVQGDKANAIYNYAADMVLTGVTVEGGKSHAIFNKGNIIGSDITINDPAEVGFNNNEDGLADIVNLTVNGGTHGVYNISQMKLTNANLTDPANNGIFNKDGGMELHGTLNVSGSTEHGLCNNAGTIIGDADLVVKNAAKNGIYNVNGGQVTLGDIDVNGANYGISTTGTLNAENITITHTVTNGIHNADTLNVSGNVSISGVYGATTADNHGNGIYNTKNMTIGGDLIIDSITAKGHTGNSSNNAIFNRGALTANGNVTIGNVTAGHAIIGTAGDVNFPGTVTVNGTVGKDNIIYFYSSAKTAHFGNLVKTSDVDKVVLKVDGSTQLNVAAGNLVGKSKDVVVANGSAVVTLNNTAITGGNNALHGAGGDIVANNVNISGSTIGMNIRNANSQITVQGVSTISNTSHGSAVHVNSKGKLSIEGALTIDCTSGKNGVKVYNGSTLALVGSGSLTINNPRIGISTDAGAIVTGDAGTSITINNAAADGFAIENNGTITMNGTVTGTGAAGNNALFKMLNNAAFGALNVPTASAREALRAEKSAVVTVNGGVLNGSNKDVVVASETSVINVNNVTVKGGNNMLYGAGGDINASGVTLDGGSIGINIRNANSEVTVSGASTINNATHGSAIHVNMGGKVTISGGSLTINCVSGKNGVKVYADGTLALTNGGSLIINNPKTGINTDAGAIVTGDAGTSITINNAAADGFAIENNGTITMNGTVTGTGAAGNNALFKMMNNAAFGALNVPTASAREALRVEKSTEVTVNGGTINGNSKDVIVATAGTIINVNNVTINGGNNALYAVGGTINGSAVTVNGSTIAINESNASSVVTLSGTNTFSNTTHGTCMHIRGALTLNEGATLTVQDPANVDFKIYATGDLTLKDGATLNIVNCQKGWNVEAGSKFNRSETSTVTVNGEPA